MLVLGLEGSANKLGVSILRDAEILSHLRETFVAPIGEGFQPRETAEHHRRHILVLIEKALKGAGLNGSDLDCIAYTKGRFHLLRVLYGMNLH